MIDRELRSLRIRLALAGFVAAYGLVLVLLAVVLASNEEVDTLERVDDGIVTFDREEQDDANPERSALLTSLVLAPIAAGLSWWWSGRAIRPVARAMTLQRHLIEETSHELRTPLSILTTNAEVLLGDPEPTIDLYRRGLERSAEVAERMRRVVESLLVDARGRARVIETRPTDLVRLTRSALDALEPLARERGLTLELTEGEAVRARVDPTSVERAVTNLVANGIGHGPPGSVVTVTVSARGDDRAEIAVVDAGPGIAPADQSAVFERYWRAAGPPGGEPGAPSDAEAPAGLGRDPGETPAGDADGTGLGLAIVRQVALAHGGSVEVDSPVSDGRGTRLRLVLLR